MNKAALIILLLAILPTNIALNCSNGGFLSTTFQRCYHFISKAQTNFDAQRRCETLGGKLLILNSSDEIRIVTEYVQYGFDGRENISSYWIGSRFMDEQYRALDGYKTLEFFNWDENEPSAESDGHCISASSKTGKWSSEPCHLPKVSICTTVAIKNCTQQYRGSWYSSSRREQSALRSTKFDVLKCKDDAIYIDPLHGCFSFIDTSVRFLNAEQQCRTLGGHLTKIDSHFKMLLLKEYAKEIFSNEITKYWIGMSRIYGKWQWTDGSDVEYSNWNDDYPLNRFSEQCVAADGSTAQWTNLSCFVNKFPFICEVSTTDIDDCLEEEIFWNH